MKFPLSHFLHTVDRLTAYRYNSISVSCLQTNPFPTAYGNLVHLTHTAMKFIPSTHTHGTTVLSGLWAPSKLPPFSSSLSPVHLLQPLHPSICSTSLWTTSFYLFLGFPIILCCRISNFTVGTRTF